MPDSSNSRQRGADQQSTERSVDERFMRVAIDLAKQGQGLVEPNPMVGCVLVRDGKPIGKGFHREFGGLHAEREALRSLPSPKAAKGATAYVSLEPCCHHGKTPPCTDALIEAGIARVVVAMQDPFKQVDGGGLRRLQQAGIETTVGLLAEQAEALNAPYLKKVGSGLPWVIAKWAMTIDGRIATVGGESQWITNQKSRHEVHRLRGRVDAIAVGMGTVESDDPMLTSRQTAPQNSPPRIAARVVFCQHRVPSITSKLAKTAGLAPLILVVGERVDAAALEPLAKQGAVVVETNTESNTEMVRVGLRVMGEQGMTNVMVEGGAQLLASFFDADQIDECHVYLGPKAFGGKIAPGPIAGSGISNITEAWPLRLVEVDQYDDDLRVVYRRR